MGGKRAQQSLPATLPGQAGPAAALPCAPSRRPQPEEDVEYPCSDGKPMAESGPQRRAMIDVTEGLRRYFRGRRADVVVECNLLLYYVRGAPRFSVAPDVFVALGLEGSARMTYKVWEEGKAPDFVLEVASTSTIKRDNAEKARIYARLGVREYWQFDAVGGLLEPRLTAGRLERSGYSRMDVLPSAVGQVWIRSEVLGAELRFDGRQRLAVFDPDRNRYLSPLDETERADRETERAERETERAVRESGRADAAEARAREERHLREELQARLAELEGLRAE